MENLSSQLFLYNVEEIRHNNTCTQNTIWHVYLLFFNSPFHLLGQIKLSLSLFLVCLLHLLLPLCLALALALARRCLFSRLDLARAALAETKRKKKQNQTDFLFLIDWRERERESGPQLFGSPRRLPISGSCARPD